MMMNRRRLGRVMAVVAVVLAVFFVGSSVLLGLGTNVQYNLFDLFGSDQQQQSSAVPDNTQQIEEAEREFQQNPGDPDAAEDLAVLYVSEGRYDDAARVLSEGREESPNNPDLALLLGNVYLQQAPAAPQDEQTELYGKAGDAFAEATRLDPENEDAYLLAGQAYDQAGQTAEAIQYYNGYLDREPEGEEARQVEERISALLEGGGESTGAPQE